MEPHYMLELLGKSLSNRESLLVTLYAEQYSYSGSNELAWLFARMPLGVSDWLEWGSHFNSDKDAEAVLRRILSFVTDYASDYKSAAGLMTNIQSAVREYKAFSRKVLRSVYR